MKINSKVLKRKGKTTPNNMARAYLTIVILVKVKRKYSLEVLVCDQHTSICLLIVQMSASVDSGNFCISVLCI